MHYKVIRVDLTERNITQEILTTEVAHDYIGGIGIGVRIVYDEVPPGVDALDPENRLVFAVSPLTGTAVPGASRYHVVGKSPQTLFTLSVSDSGGFWGPAFKSTGHDAIVIQGAADKPVYLWITEKSVEIRDAEALWGKDAFETEDIIREMLGDKRIRIAAIGPAGENLVRLASIENDKGHIAGRGGFGAVMGSKNLKAIAVRGKRRAAVKNRERLQELAKFWKKVGLETSLHKWGTGGAVQSYSDTGALPIKNLTTTRFDAEKLTGKYIREHYKLKRNPCYGCFMNHSSIIEVTEGPHKGFVGEEPEYEMLAGFGSNLGISDAGAVAVIGEHCDRLGMDAIGASWTLSLAMEAYEKGLVSKEKLGGLDLKWGNTQAVLSMMEKMATRDGFGDILAEGAAIAAERIGGDAPNYVVTTKKNMSPKCIDLRGLPGRNLSFAVASSGPTTEHSPGLHGGAPDPELGFPEGIDKQSPDRQAEAVQKGGFRKVFMDACAVCFFVIPPPMLNNLLDIFEAVTGRRIDFDEAMTIGERILNVQRCFNIRHGLTPEDDYVSERLLTAPTEGAAKGISTRQVLKGMIHEYYQVMGWDQKTGKPLRRTLQRLGLQKEIKDMWGDPSA
ncbi:MAG: aldehyde ferredoxin oxidoreductase family protein [Desulfatiglandales bacterium]